MLSMVGIMSLKPSRDGFSVWLRHSAASTRAFGQTPSLYAFQNLSPR